MKAFKLNRYAWAVGAVVLLTAFGIVLGDLITPIDLALIYLTGVVVIAAKFDRGSAFLYSLLSVSCLNFFFIPPLYSFNIYDRSYWLTFVVMLITGYVIANQASRLRLQTTLSLKREHDTQTFYAITRELTSTLSRFDVARTAAKHIAEMLPVDIVIWQTYTNGQLLPLIGELPKESLIKETSVLQWCFNNGNVAGRNTTTMPSALGLYFPLIATSGTLGVLGIIDPNTAGAFSEDEKASLTICASLVASALERSIIADSAEQSKIEAETEKLRSTLLSSVSHDLRTPLASIIGASSTIMSDTDQLTKETIRDLGSSINKESERLSRIVTNLLDVTRLESGPIDLNKQPYFIEELIGSALARLEPVLAKHKVIPRSEKDLPLVLIDGVLIEQVLTNLLENAARYTPPGSTIEISAVQKDKEILVTVADNGPGIAAGNEKKIFDKFTSITQNGAKGTGLGLAICAGIIKAHQGQIGAENRKGGGACFSFTLPISEEMKNVSNA